MSVTSKRMNDHLWRRRPTNSVQALSSHNFMEVGKMVISGYGQAVWLSPWERETVGSTPATRICKSNSDGSEPRLENGWCQGWHGDRHLTLAFYKSLLKDYYEYCFVNYLINFYHFMYNFL